ncbi:hypothetical protein EBR57_03540 [bacterium]|nr:hypothetical protein [bacterium]
MKPTHGKIGTLFEGDSGIGKSHVVRETLTLMGKRYVPIGIGCGDAARIRRELAECAAQGQIAVIDELNTNPGLIEDILTEIMSSGTSGTTLAIHPNFRVIATQNSSAEFSNRQALPDCIVSRFRLVKLPDLSFEDFERIVTGQSESIHPDLKNWFEAWQIDKPCTARKMKHFFRVYPYGKGPCPELRFSTFVIPTSVHFTKP